MLLAPQPVSNTRSLWRADFFLFTFLKWVWRNVIIPHAYASERLSDIDGSAVEGVRSSPDAPFLRVLACPAEESCSSQVQPLPWGPHLPSRVSSVTVEPSNCEGWQAETSNSAGVNAAPRFIPTRPLRVLRFRRPRINGPWRCPRCEHLLAWHHPPGKRCGNARKRLYSLGQRVAVLKRGVSQE